MDALTIRGLKKRFGTLQAVNGIDLTVPQRCIYGMIGPNGAGKTTLFSLICGFLRPDAGEIHIGEVDVVRDGLPLGKVGILPQDALFQRNVPILRQLSFYLRLLGYTQADAQAEVLATLEKVGLGDVAKRRVNTLSHGMIKRLALAQAFLGKPELILLDEPTSGLDPEQTRVICELIRGMRSTATVVVSSHNLDQLQSICDEVVIMNRGAVVSSGALAGFLGSGRRLRMTLNRELPPQLLAQLRELPGMTAITPRALQVQFEISADSDADQALGAILRALLEANLVPRQIEPSQNLESEVLALLKRPSGELDAKTDRT